MRKIAYLGPEGTFTEDALHDALGARGGFEGIRTATVREAILAVEHGEADRALVPFENSIEGSVRTTLDTLAFDADGVTIVGEHDYRVRSSLIARAEAPLGNFTAVLSHPQALAQCARFLRAQLPGAEPRAVSSTAEAVRIVSESDRPWAALGVASSAAIYGCVVLCEGIADEAENVTRFVWIAPIGAESAGGGPWKTSLVFSELGEDHAGALVEALLEFSSRKINLTRIESRPLPESGLGRYVFFVDLEGAIADATVAAAVAGLREKAESVRVLGSYPLEATL